MIAAVGFSEDLDSPDAIAEAIGQCAETLRGKTPQAGFLYAGIEHDHQALLDGVEEQYPGIQLIGCTTHGELSSAGFTADSVVLMLLHANSVTFQAEVAEGVTEDPRGAAERAATGALHGLDKPARLCVAISEPYGVNTTKLLGKLSEVIGPDVPVCGGLAADQLNFKSTYQFCNGKVYTDSLALMIFAGQLTVSTGVASGWEPMGGGHHVTEVEAEGVTLKTIDGEPVKVVWERYFGTIEFAGYRDLVAVYPDTEKPGSEGSDFYVSTPLLWNENGTLNVSPPIPEGSSIRFAQATREQILEGVENSASWARDTFVGDPDAALVFSCASRHGLLGTRVRREFELLSERVGATVPVIGFYTYGEICPLMGSVISRAHASTFVTVLIGEDK